MKCIVLDNRTACEAYMRCSLAHDFYRLQCLRSNMNLFIVTPVLVHSQMVSLPPGARTRSQWLFALLPATPQTICTPEWSTPENAVSHLYWSSGESESDTRLDCANSITGGNGPPPDGLKGCNMPCNGNATEYCGGPSKQVSNPPYHLLLIQDRPT